MLVDIVSDLHVDRWTHAPFDWGAHNRADTVVIAGDVSDDLDEVIVELHKACCVYQNVLYVDGNHEHTHHMDDLEFACNKIRKAMKRTTNFYNLYDTTFVKDGVTFIGTNAWWDFKICEPAVSHTDAIDNFDIGWNKQGLDKYAVASTIVSTAKMQYKMLSDRLDDLSHNARVCVVTHTVPNKAFLSKCYPPANSGGNSATYGSSIMRHLTKNEKVKYFVFGHNHDAFLEDSRDGKLYVNNARGRPQDFNRKVYLPYTLNM
jgi:predicted phosphodiesterase